MSIDRSARFLFVAIARPRLPNDIDGSSAQRMIRNYCRVFPIASDRPNGCGAPTTTATLCTHNVFDLLTRERLHLSPQTNVHARWPFMQQCKLFADVINRTNGRRKRLYMEAGRRVCVCVCSCACSHLMPPNKPTWLIYHWPFGYGRAVRYTPI